MPVEKVKKPRKVREVKVAEVNPLDRIYDIVDLQIEAVCGSDVLDENDNIIKKGKPVRSQCGNLFYALVTEKVGKEHKQFFRVYASKTVRKHLFEVVADNDGKGYVACLNYLSAHAGVK
jgi:hypothetical protein